MQLAIDIGNTNSKLALFNQGQLIHLESIPANEQGSLIKTVKKLSFDASILSSVAGEALDLESLLRTKGAFIRMAAKTAQPLKIDYKTPETLGVDRLAAANGAWALHSGSNILVVVAGTCITYEFIHEAGIYHGGAISPGIHMRLKAMHTFTARLPLISLVQHADLTGKDTNESMLSGAINGAQAEVLGIIELYRAKYRNLKVILSGGDLPYFEKWLESGIFAVPNIVLAGLNEILLYNLKSDANY